MDSRVPADPLEAIVHMRSLVVPLALVSIVALACSSGTNPPAVTTPTSASASNGMGGMNHGGTFAFGEPGDAGEADRTVEVTQLDTPAFEPATIEVTVGETITFAVTNAGQVPHEFVLGDAATQDEHQGEMGGTAGSMMSDAENAVGLQPSEQKSLTWTFTQAGSVLYGCHVDGHYAAGMVGEISVSEG